MVTVVRWEGQSKGDKPEYLPYTNMTIRPRGLGSVRMKRSLLFIVSFVVCAAVQAADDAVLDSIVRQFSIDEVEVTARRREEPVIPVQKLDGARLEGLSAQSVADAARYFSGVQLKDYGGVGGMKTIDVRSMGTHHVGVFYDGIEIGNAQNGTVDLGKFSMDNIEE